MNVRKNLYFVGPWVDGACMGGISILLFLYFRFFYSGYSQFQVSDNAIFFAGIFSWVVNYPHFSATTYRLYQSRAYMSQFALTAFLLPLLLLVAVAACFLSPVLFAPLFVKIYILWSPYHYSGQNLGLSLIYCRRAGVEVGRVQRFVLAAFLFSCFVAQYAAVETRSGIMPLFGVNYPLFGLPAWVASLAQWVANSLGILLVAFSLVWMHEKQRRIPLIVAMPAIAHYLWTMLGTEVFSFQALIPLFHGLQYLLLAWAVEMHERAPACPLAQIRGFLISRSLYWGAANLGGGALLFYVLPHALSGFGFELGFCTAVLFVAVQVHHFFVDGVIWKLRQERGHSPLFTHFTEAFSKVPL